MKHIEVMKLALEALEFDGFTPKDQTHRAYTTKAITALREALKCKYGNEQTSCTSSPMDCQCVLDAALESTCIVAFPAGYDKVPSDYKGRVWIEGQVKRLYKHILELYNKLEQQEPAGVVEYIDPDSRTISVYEESAQQEPVKYMDADCIASVVASRKFERQPAQQKMNHQQAAQLINEMTAQQEPVAALLLQAKQNFERNFGLHAMADWIYSDLAARLADTHPRNQEE